MAGVLFCGFTDRRSAVRGAFPTPLTFTRISVRMTLAADHKHQAPRWTMHGFRLGAWSILPLLPGVFAFGIAFGTVAARKGFTLFDTFAMSASVCAGMAQLVVLESWPDTLTLRAIAGAAMITGLVCMRFLLIGASLRPWLAGSPAGKVYPALFLLTEPNWLLSMRYRARGGDDAAFFAGSGVMVWLVWVLAAAPGYWIGASVGDPHRFGLDLIMPVFFSAMLVSLWRGPRQAYGWIVGAAVAVAADHWIGGWWYVLLGALAGSVTAGLVDERA
jgi:predicted branched-subunit amino acid permease